MLRSLLIGFLVTVPSCHRVHREGPWPRAPANPAAAGRRRRLGSNKAVLSRLPLQQVYSRHVEGCSSSPLHTRARMWLERAGSTRSGSDSSRAKRSPGAWSTNAARARGSSCIHRAAPAHRRRARRSGRSRIWNRSRGVAEARRGLRGVRPPGHEDGERYPDGGRQQGRLEFKDTEGNITAVIQTMNGSGSCAGRDGAIDVTRHRQRGMVRTVIEPFSSHATTVLVLKARIAGNRPAPRSIGVVGVSA